MRQILTIRHRKNEILLQKWNIKGKRHNNNIPSVINNIKRFIACPTGTWMFFLLNGLYYCTVYKHCWGSNTDHIQSSMPLNCESTVLYLGIAVKIRISSMLNVIKYHDEGMLGHKLGPEGCLMFHPNLVQLAIGSKEGAISIKKVKAP